MDKNTLALLEALTRTLPTLVKYGARDRNPDEEAWGAYTQAITALSLWGLFNAKS